MPPEGLNPTRRYKSFRPRQAARGMIDFTATSHHATVGLYNNSTAAQYLVLLDYQFGPDSTSVLWGTCYAVGIVGAVAGNITTLMPGDAALPGQLTQFDDTLARSLDYAPFQGSPRSGVNNVYWVHEYPFAILPPNWSFLFQDTGVSNEMQLSFLWEAIFADELDYAFEL